MPSSPRSKPVDLNAKPQRSRVPKGKAVAKVPRSKRVTRRSSAADVVWDAISTIDGSISNFMEVGKEGSLDERDPKAIEEMVELAGPWLDRYFRTEVHHIEHIPASGGALCVGNHNGGIMIPDSWVLLTAFVRHFGPERLSYALAHNIVLSVPVLGDILRKLGVLPANPESARDALRREAVVLVYPGGDEDTLRPWSKRNTIHLGKRTGFIRLALEEQVPIIPTVSIGAHETVFILNDGRKTAELLHLERFRLKTLPIVVGLPWIVIPGDLLGHIPMPSKIVVDIGTPIDFRAQFGNLDPHDPDVVWACYAYVEHRMQAMLDMLAAQRRFPIIG